VNSSQSRVLINHDKGSILVVKKQAKSPSSLLHLPQQRTDETKGTATDAFSAHFAPATYLEVSDGRIFGLFCSRRVP
jgi:hypothetical protein